MSTKRSSAPSNHDRGSSRRINPAALVDDKSLEARIGKNVVVQPDGCWLWKGQADDYGTFNGKSVHRFVFTLLVGPIRKGCHIHHICQTRGCCNPEHLREMTPGEHSAHHHELRRSA